MVDMKDRKPLISMAITKVKRDKEMSFEDEGLRASVEQMFQAMKDMPYMNDMPVDVERNEDEGDESFELRKKSRELREEADKKQREVYIDAFIEGLCSFIELKYGLDPENKDEY